VRVLGNQEQSMNQDFFQALLGVLAGGLITILGSAINFYFARRKDIETQQRESRIRYLQQQIEELYGPLWGLLEQSETIYEIASMKMTRGPDGFFRKDLTSDESKIYRFFNENYFLPINLQIVDIIRKKVHLLNEGVMPESFKDVIQNHAVRESLFQLWKTTGIDSSDIRGKPYPKTLKADIKTTLDMLRQQYVDEIALASKPQKRKRK
jgi:hypothetical protein